MNWNLVIGFGIGAILGSLIKALSDRSLDEVSYWGRSYCPRCKHHLNWYDLFPILSFVSTLGRCRYCRKKIPISYLFVEILIGLLAALLFYKILPTNFLELDPTQIFFYGSEIVLDLIIVTVLSIAFLTDLAKGFIYDRLTIPAIVITLIYLIITTLAKVYLVYQAIKISAIGKYLLPPYSDYFYRHALETSMPLILGIIMALGLGLFFGLLIVMTRGKGMGGGDFKLAIFMGLGLGFPNVIVATMLGFLSGALVGIFLLIFGKKKFGQTIPFGPFLSIGGIIAVFFGKEILNWYLSLKI